MSKINIKTMVLGSVMTNCYIVYNEELKEAVIIDPADKAREIINALDSLELNPKAILLTHGHYDHVGAAMDLKRHYGISVYASELERDVLSSAHNNLSAYMGYTPIEMEADVYLKDGEELELTGFSVKAISTPGHTQGCMCYLFVKEQEQVLFSGDTLFEGSVGRYDFPTSSGRMLFASIKEKLLCFGDELLVYPGHGNFTTIGDERINFV